MSEFEDAANQMIRAARENQQTYVTQDAAATGPYVPLEGYPAQPPPYPTLTDQRFGGNQANAYPQPPFHRCGHDDHRFACRHEQRCECGLTERLPLQLPDGL